VKRFDIESVGVHLMLREVESSAELDVLLRKVVPVDEYFADLISVVGIFAGFGVVALGEEAGIAALDDRGGVGLDFVHHAQDFADFEVEGALLAVEDVAMGWADSLRSSTSLA
jgi:hypothetical protein